MILVNGQVIPNRDARLGTDLAGDWVPDPGTASLGPVRLNLHPWQAVLLGEDSGLGSACGEADVQGLVAEAKAAYLVARRNTVEEYQRLGATSLVHSRPIVRDRHRLLSSVPVDSHCRRPRVQCVVDALALGVAASEA